MKFKLNTNRSLFENKSFYLLNQNKHTKLINKESVSSLRKESPESKAKLGFAGSMHTMIGIKGKKNILKKIILNGNSERFSETSGLFLTGEKNYNSSCHLNTNTNTNTNTYINSATNTCDTLIENERTNSNLPYSLNFEKKINLKNPKLIKILERINKTKNVNFNESESERERGYIKIIGNEFLVNRLKIHLDKTQLTDNNNPNLNLNKTKSSFHSNTIYKNVSNKTLIISKNRRFNEA